MSSGAEEGRDISKPVACKLGDVTQCVLGEVVGQLKQVGKVREEVEALKQAHAHTAQGLTYLATVSHPAPMICARQGLSANWSAHNIMPGSKDTTHIPHLACPCHLP